MVELTDEQFEAAKQCGEERLRGPRAVAARYDAGRGRVVITLASGVEIGLAPHDVEGLAGASAEDLRIIEVEELEHRPIDRLRLMGKDDCKNKEIEIFSDSL